MRSSTRKEKKKGTRRKKEGQISDNKEEKRERLLPKERAFEA